MSRLLFPWLIVTLLAGPLGCGSCGEEVLPPGEQVEVWVPTTTATDPECTGCEERVLENVGDGLNIKLYVNPNVDDELVQWSSCVHGIMDCVDEGGSQNACVASSACPQPCKDAYAQQVAGSADLQAQFAAIDAVFYETGGLCRPAAATSRITPVEEVLP